jgi:predicted secreted protein
MKKFFALLMTLALLAPGLAAAQTAPATVTITFVENPTTGYTWAVKSSDEAVLAVVDNGYMAGENAEGLEGAGGTHSWTLTGNAEGDATATFTFGQAWDGGEVAATIVYTVHVDAAIAVAVTGVTGNPEQYDPMKGTVLLLENPTTGYTWAYKASAEGILTLDSDTFIPPEAGEGKEALAGAGGTHYWVFSGAAEGDVTLTFGYARSWEEGVEPEATVLYMFHVSPDLHVTLIAVGGDYAAYDPMMADAEK